MQDLTSALSILPGPLAILAGAGISMDAPSNLLGGWDFMQAILSRILPEEVDRAIADSLIAIERGAYRRPGEYVRFESLMEELVDSSIDPELHVLDCLDDCAYPNAGHFLWLN